MNWKRICTLIKKDVKILGSNTSALLSVGFIVLIFSLLLPTGYQLLAFYREADYLAAASMLKKMFSYYPIPDFIVLERHKLLYLFFNHIFPSMFILVPVIAASMFSADMVVGEKERKTLETLLYSPISNSELLVAKVLGPACVSLVALLIAILLFSLSMTIPPHFLDNFHPVSPANWLPIIFIACPTLIILTLTMTLFLSLKVKTAVAVQQWSAILVIPVAGLFVSQALGFLTLSVLHIALSCGIILALCFFLIAKVAARFNRESLIQNV